MSETAASIAQISFNILFEHHFQYYFFLQAVLLFRCTTVHIPYPPVSCPYICTGLHHPTAQAVDYINNSPGMKPGLPQGTRDFGAAVVRKRNYIFNHIRAVFELYGFQPLETPAFENLTTLTGKYGDEGDKLIFKILNNGLQDPRNAESAKEGFQRVLLGNNDPRLTERALKYDLTIPFARYVAMNHGQLTMPFKRYQVQPVWRADRPQKGRYREFYQCDADVVGSHSLLNETELACIYHEVFNRLQLHDYSLHINHRKILRGIMEVSGAEAKEKQILVIIDKTDKIGIEGVKKELESIDIPAGGLERLLSVYSFNGSGRAAIDYLKEQLAGSATGLQGVQDLEYMFEYASNLVPDLAERLRIDLTLARGLEYYTGIIFEARAPERVKIGSIGGGGRYDNLTGLFDVPNVPGVGISFGVDRIYDVLEELTLFPENAQAGTRALFLNLGEQECRRAFGLMQQLRAQGISCELYHEQSKFDKQFKYADKKAIPFAIIIGSKEMEENTCVLKDLKKGIQQVFPTDKLEELVSALSDL